MGEWGPRAAPRPGGVGRLLAATALAIAAALVWGGGLGTEAAEAAEAGRDADPRPNVIVVVTDDQTLGSFTPEYMPRTFKHFVEPGTEFTQAIVATPLCCPSRAALLTGQYGHNNGVLRNQYRLLEDNRNVLPAWLSRVGVQDDARRPLPERLRLRRP